MIWKSNEKEFKTLLNKEDSEKTVYNLIGENALE